VVWEVKTFFSPGSTLLAEFTPEWVLEMDKNKAVGAVYAKDTRTLTVAWTAKFTLHRVYARTLLLP